MFKELIKRNKQNLNVRPSGARCISSLVPFLLPSFLIYSRGFSYLEKVEDEKSALDPEEGDHGHEQGRAVVARVQPQQAPPEEEKEAASRPTFRLPSPFQLRFDDAVLEKSLFLRIPLPRWVVSLRFIAVGRGGKKHGGREHFEDGGAAGGDGADSQQSLPRGIS